MLAFWKRKNKALVLCLLFSFFFHVGALFVIHHYSLWFCSPIKSSLLSKSFVLLEKKDKQSIIESVFKQMNRPSNVREKINQYQPKSAHETLTKINRKTELPSFQKPSNDTTIVLEETDTSKWQKKASLFSPKLNQLKATIHLDILSDIEQVALAYNPQEQEKKHTSSKKQGLQEKTKEVAFATKKDFHIQNNFSLNQDFHFSGEKQGSSKSMANLSQISQLNAQEKKELKNHYFKLPSLKKVNTISAADDFNIDVLYIPDKEEGFIFAITFIPMPTIDLPRIKQNFFFLIDRSNPIQTGRLKASRDAVYHALSHLKKEDKFNIIAFDSKFEKFFAETTSLNAETKKEARQRLMKLRLASFFATPNIHHPMYSVSSQDKKSSSIDNIIIFSNGEALGGFYEQRSFMAHWNYFNDGGASVFSLSMNYDKKIPDLEILTCFNRGWNINTTTKGSVKRKMLKLMQALNYPIAKDISCSAISQTKDASIKIYPLPMTLPNLYKSQPFVLIGSSKTMDDFIVFIQGKNHDKWINIKKHISFSKAKLATSSLKKQWDIQKAYAHYYSYLYDQDSKHLKQAKALLQEHDMSPAFQ